MWFGLTLSAQTTIVYGVDALTQDTVDFKAYDLQGNVWSSKNGKIEIPIVESSLDLTFICQDFLNQGATLLPGKSYTIRFWIREKEIGEVVVTDVYKRRTKLNTVLNVEKIGLEKLEDLAAVDLQDALGYQNNIRISKDQAIGASGLTLMGLSGSNVKLLIDGTPVIGRLFDQVDIEQFSMQDVQQIEMIKGPMSIIYGSNALAGTINLVSKDITKRSGSMQAYYESDGQYNVNGGLSLPINKQHAISLSAGRRMFDGWSTSDDRTFDWIPKEQYNGRLMHHWRKGKQELRIRSEFLNARLLDRGKALAPWGENAIDQHYRNQRWDNSIFYSKSFKASTLTLNASNNDFSRLKNKYFKDLITLEETLVPVAAEQDTQRFNASVLRAIYSFQNKKLEQVIGFDGNHELGLGKRISEGQKSQTDAALFWSAERTFKDKLVVRGGLRYAYNSAFNAPLLYSVQTRWILPKNTSLRLAYGKGFRAPSLKELYMDFTDSRHEVYGNAALLPEESNSFTGVLSKYVIKGGLNYKVEVEGFYNHIENKIELVVTGPIQAQYGNIGLQRTAGGTINQEVKIKNVQARLDIGYTGIDNRLLGATASAFNWSPQGVAQLRYTLHGFTANAFINYTGSFNRLFSDVDSGDVNILEQDAYTTIDLTLGKTLVDNRLQLSAGVRNLLNVTQVNANRTEVGAHTPSTSFVAISPGRTIFISVKYAFFK